MGLCRTSAGNREHTGAHHPADEQPRSALFLQESVACASATNRESMTSRPFGLFHEACREYFSDFAGKVPSGAASLVHGMQTVHFGEANLKFSEMFQACTCLYSRAIPEAQGNPKPYDVQARMA